jgi:hypothetical protein
MINVSSIALGRRKLVELKLRAKRRGLWFRALSRVDRALVDLTIKVAVEVRSSRLAHALLSVMKKMEVAFEKGVSRDAPVIGFSLARKLSALAQKWGNRLAKSWASDVLFAKFLAIMHLNGFRSIRG